MPAFEIIAGEAVINGFPGTITMTGAATFNAGTRSFSAEFKSEDVPSQDGGTIATRVASQQKRKIDVEFFPTGATRAAAIAVVASLEALLPLDVITIGGSGSAVAATVGTWNLISMPVFKESRDGILSVSLSLLAHESTTAGTFAGLTIAS
jgi:hypothetical protein